MADRRFDDSLYARALPPFNPPRRPSSTARGSLGFSPAFVASSTIRTAKTFRSFEVGRLLDRFGMAPGYHGPYQNQGKAPLIQTDPLPPSQTARALHPCSSVEPSGGWIQGEVH